MNTDPGSTTVYETLRRGQREFTALFRQRLRARRFWAVQALVIGITLLHGVLEATEVLGEHEAVSFIPVSFYFIPVVYAGLNFGMEGALPTALWVAALATPNVFVWHDGVERAGELTQLAIMVGIAVLVARRVDEESRAKRRAEQVSAQLAQLNATAAAVGRSLEPSIVVGDVLATLLGQGQADRAWIVLAEDDPARPMITVRARRGSDDRLPRPWEAGSRRVIRTGTRWSQGIDPASPTGPKQAAKPSVVVLPVKSANRVLAALGVACERVPLSPEDISLLEGVAHQIAVALDNIRHYQEAKETLDELTRAQENLRAYLRLATDAQEEERKRLARELHDDTVQALVVIRSSLDAVVGEQQVSLPVRERLQTLKKLMHSAVEDVRRFSRDLRPSVLDDLGLVHAIDWLVNDLAQRTGVSARLEAQGEPRRLKGDVEVAIYRIVQEALRNVERHSGATEVLVSLCFGPGSLSARVADNGRGFQPRRVLAGHGKNGGLGLVGMEERAKLIGGRLTIDSADDRGTEVAVTVDAAAVQSV